MGKKKKKKKKRYINPVYLTAPSLSTLRSSPLYIYIHKHYTYPSPGLQGTYLHLIWITTTRKAMHLRFQVHIAVATLAALFALSAAAPTPQNGVGRDTSPCLLCVSGMLLTVKLSLVVVHCLSTCVMGARYQSASSVCEYLQLTTKLYKNKAAHGRLTSLPFWFWLTFYIYHSLIERREEPMAARFALSPVCRCIRNLGCMGWWYFYLFFCFLLVQSYDGVYRCCRSTYVKWRRATHRPYSRDELWIIY